MAKNIKSGNVIETSTGERVTVGHIIRTYTETTPRYKNDPNPTPADTIVVRAAGAALHTVSLRPGSFKVVK